MQRSGPYPNNYRTVLLRVRYAVSDSLTGVAVFERFTEKARRVIFFARYEASNFGSPYIESEHFLLALLREDFQLRLLFTTSQREAIHAQIAAHFPAREKISTSVDLPLSHDLHMTLAYAFEESVNLGHAFITPAHLLLGVLRRGDSFAASLLAQHGVTYESVLPTVQDADSEPTPASFRTIPRERPAQRAITGVFDAPPPLTPFFAPILNRLVFVINRALLHVELDSEVYPIRKLKRLSWLRIEALGYLVDLASIYYLALTSALNETRLVATTYAAPQTAHVSHFREFSWPDLVDAWTSLNQLIVCLIALLPEEKLTLSCRAGIDASIPLPDFITHYVIVCEDIMGQILSHL